MLCHWATRRTVTPVPAIQGRPPSLRLCSAGGLELDLPPSDSFLAGPSRTSILVAAARAFGSHDPDPSIRNPDWLAEQLVGPEERARIEPHPLGRALSEPYMQGAENPEVAGLVRLMMARTRFIDERLVRAVERGARQVAILGAGFDSRAYRFRETMAHVKFIELDAPETQEYKRRRMEKVAGPAPANLTYAPIDFRTDSLADVLARAGCEQGVPSFFSWEGVSMYIPEEGVRATLAVLARFGGTVVMDYTTRERLQSLIESQGTPRRSYAAGWGEPWIFGIAEACEAEFFGGLGFEVIESLRLVSKEATARYATRRDGTVIGASIRRVRSPQQAARLGYTLVELRARHAT
jgi:methyltransferase (TIGR00027 family)